jgi:hypothetical protein
MKVQISKKVDGVGTKLYMISYTEIPTFYSELSIGNDEKDVLVQFFERSGWDEEYVRSTFSNMGWVFDEDWDEDEDEDEGCERIELDFIGDIEV